MTTAQWTRLADLVPEALDQPLPDRADFLDRACRTPGGALDETLLREATSLVAAADTAATSERLRSPVDGLAGGVAGEERLGAPAVPRRIGAWAIRGLLGEGGMGVVYRATRADGAFEREVALKRLRPGPGTHLDAARLDAERRTLARLEHDGIARLYDGGVDDDGAPFLVMERVDGLPLTDFADRAELDVRARVVLFVEVCAAVAYAHRHLVVHRDLKPSNVLVTADGRPKLLDFGVAKLLDADAEVTQSAAMTPAYAAPEQLTGDAVTTATDVYALGVLLYETLAGRRPYDLSGLTASGIERAVCETTPPPPSAVAPSARSRALRGDLDTVVATAMTKEPGRRYATAEALGEDLRRVLVGEPIAARPAGRAYRARLFVRRHRTAVAAAAVVALALIGGIASTTWQARVARAERDRAEARFGIARDAAHALLYDVPDAIASLEGGTEAREVVLRQSIAYLDRLAADAGDDPALRVDLAEAYFRVGSVQGLPTGANLGRTADAAQSYRRGLALLPSDGPLGDTLTVRAERVRAHLLQKLGVVRAHTGDLDGALALLDRAIATYARVRVAAPGTALDQAELASAFIDRGDYRGHPHFPNAGLPDSASADYARAEAALDAIPSAARTSDAERKRGVVYERQGTMRLEASDVDGALAFYTRSQALRERLAALPDASYDVRRDAGVAHETIGRTLAAQGGGRLAEALAAHRRALAVYQTLADEDPADVGARRTLAIQLWHVAGVLGGPAAPNLGRRAEARATLDRALVLFQTLDGAEELLQGAEADRRALGS